MPDIRFLPEWEPVEHVLLALPNKNTDWAYILPAAIDQYRRLVKAITDEGIKVILLCDDEQEAKEVMKDCNQDFMNYITIDYNDTWTRDYCMISLDFSNTHLRDHETDS